MKKQMISLFLCVMMVTSSLMVTGCKKHVETTKEVIKSVVDSNNKEKKVKEEPVKLDDYKKISSYMDIYMLLNKLMMNYQDIRYEVDDMVDSKAINGTTEKIAEETADSSDKNSSLENSDFSKTNLVEEGIEEGDIIKTDGKYLYIYENYIDHEERWIYSIKIVRANAGDMKIVSEIKLDAGKCIQEFYLLENQIVIVGTEMYEHDEQNTFVSLYDISERSNPVEQSTVHQGGYYDTSRLVNGYLYLVSTKGNWRFDWFTEGDTQDSKTKKMEDKYKSFLPDVDGEILPVDQIYIPSETNTMAFRIFSAIKINEKLKVEDKKSIMSENAQLYMTDSNMYFYQTSWSDSYDRYLNETKVFKFTYDKGSIQAKATGEIKGTINDTFAINEYKGNLRIVSTVEDSMKDEESTYRQSNTLYILDEKLEVLSAIKEIAVDELVYSARFMGNTGYFVTFRQTDPLFSVDLKDPKNPKIIGELKITGFSDYLHFYGKGLLLGVGIDMDDEGVERKGIKISMFDISDPSNVKEVNKKVLKEYDYTSVQSNYKNIIVNPEKNIIAFSSEGYDEEADEYFQDQLVFSYNKREGFVCENKVETNRGDYSENRLAYIGEIFYVVNFNKNIMAYSLTSKEKIGYLSLE